LFFNGFNTLMIMLYACEIKFKKKHSYLWL